MQVQPYLFFDGRAEEALEFYRARLGAEVQMLMRFKECPDSMPNPPPGDKVMHSSFRIGDTTVMASDGMCHGKPSFQGFSLSLIVPDEAEANRLFTAALCIAAGRRITDGQTGFRAFSRRALDAAEIIHDYNYAQGTLVPYKTVLWADDKVVEETSVGTITFGQKVDEDLFKVG